MSPAAGSLLLQAQHIITACLVRGAVKFTGAEDIRELAADGTVQAARMIDSAERKGKTVVAGSVAHYVLQAMKAGRRHGYAGRSDVMSPGAQLAGHASLVSMDAPTAADDEDGDEDAGGLHEVLAATGDDPDTTAARDLDWALVYPQLDDRRKTLLKGMALGYGTGELAAQLRVSPPRACQLRESLGTYLVKTWGDTGIAASTTLPTWRSGLRAAAEKRTARYERAVR